MTVHGLSILAVVPARGGSKSIPRKNLAKIAGRSLIEIAAVTLSNTSELDACVLSTDDEEMADEGRRVGLQVPFMRPAELAQDRSRAAPMWQHAWLTAEQHLGTTFDISVLIEPTSPMRVPEDITATINCLVLENHNAAATASRNPSHFTPEKALMLSERNTLEFFYEKGAKYTIRQNIPSYFHRNGLCYAVKRETLLSDGNIFENDCGAVITDRPVVDINEPLDLEFAEFLMKKDQRFGHSAVNKFVTG
ncbi:MAG: acylneuraminate cytidylyltransferase family protein [Pseudomonadota bacterium]